MNYMVKKELTEETLDDLLCILGSNKSDEEKAEECQKIISYSELYRIKRSNIIDNEEMIKKIEKVFLRYKYFKASGVFYHHTKNMPSGYEQLKVKQEFDNLYETIVNEDLNRISKIIILLEKFPTRTILNKKYTSLRKKIKDTMDKKFITISIFYDSITKQDRELCEKIVTNNIKVDPDYADYIIRTFLDLIKDNSKTEILLKLKITEIEFECMLGMSSEKLQEEFDNYMNDNKERLVNETLNRLIYIKDNIISRNDFNLLEFYKLVPLKEYTNNFSESLLKFINKHSKSSRLYAAFEDYLFKYSIREIHIIDEDKLLDSSSDINETNMILNYMKENNYPMIVEIYKLLLMKKRYDNLDDKKDLKQK